MLGIPKGEEKSFGRGSLFRGLLFVIGLSFIFSACNPTYQRETIKESVKELAKKEYKLDVEVKEVGDTLGVQFRIRNMLGEMVAEDQLMWKQMEDLMMVLSRVTLSADKPPAFFVVDIVDEENPNIHFVLTRYVRDLQMLMAEALSRTQFLDRLLMEFVIGKKTIPFDPYEIDLIRLMMMAIAPTGEEGELVFRLEEVYLPDFLTKVTSNTLRRIFREEKKLKRSYTLRKVETSFVETSFEENSVDRGKFEILLDLISTPQVRFSAAYIEAKILPKVALEAGKIFRGYKFTGFADIVVIEKNSGKALTVGRK